jgi:acyl-CoA thioesterase
MDSGEFSHASCETERQKDLIKCFNSCQFARLLGMIVIEAAPGMARVAMKPGGKANPSGVVHGGAVFSLADHAFGVAANLENVPQVAVSACIWYLSPASGSLMAVAQRVSETDAYSVYSAKVFEGERLIATFDGVGMKQNPDLSGMSASDTNDLRGKEIT